MPWRCSRRQPTTWPAGLSSCGNPPGALAAASQRTGHWGGPSQPVHTLQATRHSPCICTPPRTPLQPMPPPRAPLQPMPPPRPPRGPVRRPEPRHSPCTPPRHPAQPMHTLQTPGTARAVLPDSPRIRLSSTRSLRRDEGPPRLTGQVLLSALGAPWRYGFRPSPSPLGPPQSCIPTHRWLWPPGGHTDGGRS